MRQSANNRLKFLLRVVKNKVYRTKIWRRDTFANISIQVMTAICLELVRYKEVLSQLVGDNFELHTILWVLMTNLGI